MIGFALMLQELHKDLTKVKHAQKNRSDNLQLLGGLLHNIAYVMFRSASVAFRHSNTYRKEPVHGNDQLCIVLFGLFACKREREAKTVM